MVKKLKQIQAKGTHYSAGVKIGKSGAKKIQEVKEFV